MGKPWKGVRPQGSNTLMTRYCGSESNTAAWEIEFQHASQKVGKNDDKNEDFSKSVNSFEMGAIFLDSLDHDLSRNTSVVSVCAF